MIQTIQNRELLSRILKWSVAFVAVFLLLTPLLKLYIHDVFFPEIFGANRSLEVYADYRTYKFIYYFIYPILGLSAFAYLWNHSFFYIALGMGVNLIYEKYFHMDEMFILLSQNWHGAGLDKALYVSSYLIILIMLVKYFLENYLSIIFKVLTSKVTVTCVDESVGEILKRLDTSKLKPVLAIDDDDDFLRLLRIKLEKQGRHVITVNSALEGIEMAKAVSPAVILLDLNMPVIDGYSALDRLKSDPSTKKIKIIGMTADSSGKLDRFDDGHFKRDGIVTLIRKIPV